MLGRLWRQWRIQRDDAAVRRRAIPDDLWKRTLVRYPFLRRDDPAEAAELRRLTSLFLDRKEFSAAGGLRLTDAIAVAIAAQAVLPVLKLGLERYDGFVGVVVHPGQVVARRIVGDDIGVVHEYDEVLAGEAMAGGPVMLSWRDVRAGGRAGHDALLGYNVVIHEFAHVLDMADGLPDGVPLLPPELPRQRWLDVLRPAFERHLEAVERAEAMAQEDEGAALDALLLDPYGASGIDEFFAVASETFFVNGAAMAPGLPDLYDVLSRFYRQDPAAAAAPPARERSPGLPSSRSP